MQRLGSEALQTREMVLDDILYRRIDLLLIMAKDILRGKRLGDQQHKAMEKNAIHIEIECAALIDSLGGGSLSNLSFLDRSTCQCLKHLAGMIRSATNGQPVGASLKKEMLNKVNSIIKQWADHNLNPTVA